MAAFREIDFKDGEYIYADTNVLLEYMGYNGNSAARNQCNEIITLAYNSGVPLVVSHIAFEEILQVIIISNFKLAGYHGQKQIKELQEKNVKEYNRILGNAFNEYQTYKHRINGSDVFLKSILNTSPETYADRDELMFKHNMFGVKDALHIALACEYGIDYFMTCDKDFKNLSISGIEIIHIEDK